MLTDDRLFVPADCAAEISAAFTHARCCDECCLIIGKRRHTDSVLYLGVQRKKVVMSNCSGIASDSVVFLYSTRNIEKEEKMRDKHVFTDWLPMTPC